MVRGFLAASTACGLKASGKLDLGVIVSTRPCKAAGMFTTNRFAAAPVFLSKQVLSQQEAEGVSGIIVNSGQANACTGEQGLRNAALMRSQVRALLSEKEMPGDSFVMSTGVIGQQLDMHKVSSGINTLFSALDGSDAAFCGFARSIMTTDTRPKMSKRSLGEFELMGFSKGAGMIHPNMATMLSIICTDLDISQALLQRALEEAVHRSFNAISIDGDTSTNDSVVLLANGMRGNALVDSEDDELFQKFKTELCALCTDLAQMIVRDAEGATKFLTVKVMGLSSELDAKKIGRNISQSLLVKTALFGQDPNWGRILCAAGNSGVSFDTEKVSLWISSENQKVSLVEKGTPVKMTREAENVMKQKNVAIELDFASGSESFTVWSSDLSYEYVKINAEYTT